LTRKNSSINMSVVLIFIIIAWTPYCLSYHRNTHFDSSCHRNELAQHSPCHKVPKNRR
jgi:hypothetical protein